MFSIGFPKRLAAPSLTRTFWAFLVLCLCSLAPSPGAAQSLRIDNLVLDSAQGRIKARFVMDVSNVGALKEHLGEGGGLTLAASAKLTRSSKWWLSRDIAESSLLIGIEKNANGLYAARSQSRPNPITGQDLGEVLRKAFSELVVDLGPWDLLEHGFAYTITVDARLGRTDVSPWLKNALFFWSFDAAKAVRYRLEFVY